MKRRLNYTRRKSIPSDRFLIRIKDGALPGAPATFEASINLTGFDLPSHGKVFLDPYVNTSSMRFPYGTVGQITPPENCDLSDIDQGRAVLFRLLVVDGNANVGKIFCVDEGHQPSK